MEKKEILDQIEKIEKKYGAWAYDIPLPFDVWTGGNKKIPHTRLKRIVQVVSDLVGKPLSECRILDLGSLDGIFSIEFAQHGAKTLGIEVREDNIKKALFSKEVLNLNNLDFCQDDARNISVELYGEFDAIICSGLLYHLTAPDAIELIGKMFNMSTKVVIIDTHIAMKPETCYKYNEDEYFGQIFSEHGTNDSQLVKSKQLWKSWDNNESFWFTRPSLINILNKTGFTSTYECLSPLNFNFIKKETTIFSRCTFVAIKSKECKITNSPAVNNFKQKWPENSLQQIKIKKSVYKRILFKLKKIIK